MPFVEAAGHRLFLRDEGPRTTDYVVLLLHGWPDDGSLFSHQVAALAQAGYRVLCPDLPGAGRSAKPQAVDAYKLGAIVKVLAAMLDGLGVQRVAVVGHDWGAATAWRFGYAFPERVRRMVVLSTGHPGAGTAAGGAHQRARWWYMFWFQYQPQAEEGLQADDWVLFREIMQGEAPAAVQSYIQALSAPGALTASLNWYRANFRPELFGQTRLRPMPQLRLPVMGVWSTGDRALTEAQMAASSGYVAPGLWRYERLEGAGHWMARDAPQRVTALLLDFLGAPEGSVGGGGGGGGERSGSGARARL